MSDQDFRDDDRHPITMLTKHAKRRMEARRLPEDAVNAALDHGRIVHARGAEIYAIGRNEIARCRREGVDLSAYEGVQVVCSPDGTVLTVYKNRNFRGLRSRARHRTAA